MDNRYSNVKITQNNIQNLSPVNKTFEVNIAHINIRNYPPPPPKPKIKQIDILKMKNMMNI